MSTKPKREETILGETGYPIVAVWLCVTVTLPSGRTLPYLACTRYLNAEGFLAEGVKENSATVLCPHCQRAHEVFSLADAIKYDRLNVSESFATIAVSDIVAMTLRVPERRTA